MAQNAAFSTLKEGKMPTTTRTIPLNAETLEQLNNVVASTGDLKRAGYVIEKLTDVELDQKRRCTTCGIRSKPRAALPTQMGDPSDMVALLTYVLYSWKATSH